MKQALEKGPAQRSSFLNNYRALITVGFLLFSMCAHAQYDSTKLRQIVNAYGFDWKNGKIRGSFIVPTDTPKLAVKDSAAIAYSHGQFWGNNGYGWSHIGNGADLPTWQQTLSSPNGNILTQDNEIDVSGYDLGLSNASKFYIDADSAVFIPTIPDADSSMQIATTKWVKKNLSSLVAGLPTYTASDGIELIGNNFKLTDTLDGVIGPKFQWIPEKSAFRAGSVAGTQWDVSNIGNYSFAAGSDNSATGLASMAMGTSSQATGPTSFAIGNGSVASGSVSAAIGIGNVSSNSASFSTGDHNTSAGYFSSTFGTYNYIKTLNGAAFGAFNDTTGYSNQNPTTQVSTDPIFIIGNGASPISRSNAFKLLRNGRATVSAVWGYDNDYSADMTAYSFVHKQYVDNKISDYLLIEDTTDMLSHYATNANVNTKAANIKTNTTDVGNIGAGEDNLITYPIPAGKLANDGDYAEFTMTIVFGATDNNKQVKLYYGGTNFYASGTQAQNEGAMEITGKIIRTSATSQKITFHQINNTTLFPDYADFTTASETMANAITLKATGEGVDNDDIVQKILLVKYFPGN